MIDAQTGFLLAQPKLIGRLSHLLALGRTHGFAIYYSRFDSQIDLPFPTPGHTRMKALLAGNGATDFPKELTPRQSDRILDSRATLSIFQGTGLLNDLRAQQIEHLVLAGPLTHLSLDSSLRDASQYDFHVTVIDDCVGQQGSAAGADTVDLTFPRYAHSLLSLTDFDTIATATNGDPG